MRASEFITEVFQPGKTNWKWRRQSSDEAFASFIVADREYQWHAFTSEANLTKWEIQFRLMRVPTDPDGLDLFGTTGTGNSAEVLSTAVDITREFIKQYGLDKVEEITFNAKEDSRIGLYAKMINRLLPDWDLYQKYSKDRGMEYHLTDRRAYDKPENKTTEGQGVAEGTEQSLLSMVSQDQSERNEYKNFVKSQAGGDWSKGAKMYAQLKKRPSNDIFGDASRLNQFMKMKFDFDKFTDEDWDNYWLLAQHCDDNRDFQKNALSIIKKYQGTDHSHYKYLYDRISMGLTGKQKYGTQNTKKQGVDEGVSNNMSTEDMIAYLRQHHDTNLEQDYLNHVNTFSKFVLKDIPTNTLKIDLPSLDREKVERYKKMDQSKAPPIVLGGKYILDGYHRANAVKELGIPTIKAYVGITTK